MSEVILSAIETREQILQRLRQDLIGPFDLHEELKTRPLDVYLSGILWPLESTHGTEDDDGANVDEDEDQGAGRVSVFGQMKPSTMGLSFALAVSKRPTFDIHYSFGAYSVSKNNQENRVSEELWLRRNIEGVLEVELKDNSNSYIDIAIPESPLLIKLNVRNKISNGMRLVTVTLINASRLEEGDKIDGNAKSIFQSKIRVEVKENTSFIGLPDDRLPIDEDEESARLLYWAENSYAVGHQCAATWTSTSSPILSVETDWLPTESVPMFSQAGHQVFSKLISSKALEAERLATQNKDELIRALTDLVNCYLSWIEIQKQELVNLPTALMVTADRHIKDCFDVSERIKKGIGLLDTNKDVLQAFRIANLTMSIQHAWKFEKESQQKNLSWRPFQIAFILLTLESITNPKSSDRETLDLLWFPTGGGKTEAYLAIIAFGAVFKRLSKNLNQNSFGNYAVMRYTLRLLTSQQFERASAMVLALELIRKGLIKDITVSDLGETPFSIGLWVGDAATPNTFDKAKAQRGLDFGTSAEQITKCFNCKKKLTWVYDDILKQVRPGCSSPDCQLGLNFGIWPIATVDEDIYSMRPTLLIGTVDKFAQLPRKKEMRYLFGFKSEQATELIIQDELHLISGPLGTIVGAYELAIDWLLTINGIRPKVIGSTATIRRAQSQVRSLFDRTSCQFPPPGLSYKDSGFAVVDIDRPARIYVGLSNAGRSAKFTFQAVAGSLLQSGGNKDLGDVKSRDGYTTLLMYFNALRELGGAIVQVLDDVPDSILLYANLRGESARSLDAPRELTSTRSQTEIIEILDDLSKSCDSQEKVDVVLATNMVSVGVDVPRLGLMQVNGQPKTRSEYIQSTSRVGRAEFPGLVVVVHNILRARDRSHFETFASWHRRLYRDVEATSVTPFASRSRDRTLKTLIVSMVRHSDPGMLNNPDLKSANSEIVKEIVLEIQRRVNAINPAVSKDVAEEVRTIFDEWSTRDVEKYFDDSSKGIRKSLLQSAERFAQKIAVGLLPGYAWPVMNSMRSVEPSTPFRLKERRNKSITTKFELNKNAIDSEIVDQDLPPWRQI